MLAKIEKIPGHPKEEGCSITWVAWGTRLGAFNFPAIRQEEGF